MVNVKTRALVATIALATALLPAACKHKTPPPPRVVPTTLETSAPNVLPPPPEPMAAPGPTAVAPPTDFVRDEPKITSEMLPNDIEELNRTAESRGWVQDAFFSYDESTLNPQAQAALGATATWLKSHPEISLLIEGHCDERGTEQYNLALGDRRANIAREYLATLGVDAARIKTVSYGVERPFDAGHTEEAWAKNRRDHLVLAGAAR
jgi:peptidoglycan-associated lipoprotein